MSSINNKNMKKKSNFISPEEFKAMGYRIKRKRKYASYQNHLNRKYH